ncbi:annexin A5 [Latimeria chalumnae]|uniref:annexin A5 n=1 Tax=Latimeria chalumnae TaxID=7897 RepID=UPI0006D90596|nr:PREDICTED: annexin A5 [Latimeria chalumnae]|eukprot:XP_014345914.1 PREDICTED: annexin A5 [Latimeria chalumnae]
MAKVTTGTVKDFPGFDANKDAEDLRAAMKGFGTDEDAILQILASRSNAQRQKISSAFKTLFGRDLVDDLKSEVGGTFEKLLVALMKTPVEYDAYELRNAIKGAGTAEKVLIEILASRSNREICDIIKAYKAEYDSDLEEDIVGDTGGHFQRMLVVLLQANRTEDSRVLKDLVDQDAQDLFAAGEMKWGTDEDKFITILGTRSVAHLRKVFDQYMKVSGYEIEESICNETSGHLENLLLAVVKCVRSVPAYFAECLYNSMKGGGTDDDTLMRIMVSRSEVDLLDVRKQFRTYYGTSLYSMIKNDTSGDYRKTLLHLCGGEDE